MQRPYTPQTYSAVSRAGVGVPAPRSKCMARATQAARAQPGEHTGLHGWRSLSRLTGSFHRRRCRVRGTWQALAVSVALIGGASGGCRSPSHPPASSVRGSAIGRIPITRFGDAPAPFARWSGFQTPLRRVVSDEAAWRETWSRLGRSSVAPLPAVDFTRERVAVVALGQRPTTAYDVVIDSAVAARGRLTVWWHTLLPLTGCFGGDAITQPVDLVRLPRVDGAVEFRKGPDADVCPRHAPARPPRGAQGYPTGGPSRTQ